jgi:amidase
MADMAFWSAKKLAAAIRRGTVSSLELLDHYIERMERLNPQINAIIATDLDGARKRARAADRALARGKVLGPLHGVPMTVKESFSWAGLPTTWGVPMFRDNRFARNAVAVDRLLAAGAVVFGKTNVPIYLGDWQSYNDIYGTTNNPWDQGRSPGGSSGGSAAALASGMTGLELGSDIGGSVRVPAHFCGVYAHKPTHGLCPGRGHMLVELESTADIAVIGPLARSAEDLATALSIIAGPDTLEAAGYRLALKAPAKKELRQFKVAVLLDDPNAPVDGAVANQLQALVDFLGKRRVKVTVGARPAIAADDAFRTYLALLYAVITSRQPREQFEQDLEAAKGLAPDDTGFRAGYLRGATLYHRDWLALNEKRLQMRRRWVEFFGDYDLLLCPPAPVPAYPHDHRPWAERSLLVNGEARAYEEPLFWAGYSCMAYLPASVAPIGKTPEGLPVGVQIVGPPYGDLSCIAFARLLEREYRGFESPPGFA